MYRHFFKRLIGFSAALCGIVILSPLMIVVTVWLHLANKGAGAFFLQERPGKNGKIFKLIKFKSMTDERDDEGKLLPDKIRLTKVGTFIRKTSIDELPQLINVLKGDMSLVGPRPLLPQYLSYYTEREKLRHTVRPGITGLAQVFGRNNLGWNERLELDVKYVECLSLKTDIMILVRTIVNVFAKKDVNVIPGNGINSRLDQQRQSMNTID